MIKSIGDLISTQRNSLTTVCVILEGFARIFFCKLLCLSDGSMHVGYMINFITTETIGLGRPIIAICLIVFQGFRGLILH
jgi:hypothetical protein